MRRGEVGHDVKANAEAVGVMTGGGGGHKVGYQVKELAGGPGGGRGS